MTFKKSVNPNPRTFYVSISGDDTQDGVSIDTPFLTIQAAIDTVNALSPPPDVSNPSSILITGSGVFSETGLTFPEGCQFDAPNIFILPTGGNVFFPGSFANFQLVVTGLLSDTGTVFTIDGQTVLAIDIGDCSINGDGSIAFHVIGASDDFEVSVSRLALVDENCIGILDETTSDGAPDIYNINELTLDGINTVGIRYNPSLSTSEAVLRAGAITEVTGFTGTLAIDVLNATLNAQVPLINADTAIHVASGATLNITAGEVTGDIIVDAGGTLNCTIALHTGTITRNGTINGQINDGGETNFYGGFRVVKNPGNQVTIDVPAVVTPYDLILPPANGVDGQQLLLDSSLELQWQDPTSIPGGSTTEVQFNNAGSFDGISGITTDGTNLNVSGRIDGNGAGGLLHLKGKDGTVGGPVRIQGGFGTNDAGGVDIFGGGADNGKGGSITATGGDGGQDDGSGAGGSINQTGGAGGFDSGNGGSINLTSGISNGFTADSGSITLDIGSDVGGGGAGKILLAPSRGKVMVGGTDPKSNLHIETDQVSGLGTVPSNRGVIITGSAGHNRLYFENPVGTSTERVFSLGLESGNALEFSSYNDAGSGFITENILTLGMDGRVAIGTANPDLSSQLEILTTARGFLQPRLTDAERIGISSPATGLSLFDTTVNIPEFYDGTQWKRTSAIGVEVVEIFTSADLDALASGGVITVSSDLQLIFKDDVVTSNRFVTDNATLRMGGAGSSFTLTYTGTGDFISGTGNITIRAGVTLQSGSTGTLWNIVQGSTSLVVHQDANWVNWDDHGTIKGGIVSFQTLNLILWTGPLVFDSNTFVNVETIGTLLVPSSGHMFEVRNQEQEGSILRFTGVTAVLTGTTTTIYKVDPAILASTQMSVISGTVVDGGGNFDTSGITGTFTDTNNASIALTTIDSVSDSSGVARFNFTVGPTLFVNQEVDIVNFVTQTNYNQTGMITTVGAGFFEIASIAFTADDATGDFSSDSIELEDIATALSDGDTLVIDGNTESTYDGGATVYNQLTNSFQINRNFTLVQVSGAWDTSGLDQTDPRVLSLLQQEQADSRYIATAFVNANSTATGTIVNNTFTDMVFGGVGLVKGSTMERWKLINEVNGTFEYIGNQPFSGLITFDFTVVSSGGTVDFRFKWEIDTGSGFGDLPDNVESLVAVGSSASSISKTFPLSVNKGDQIKPQITRNSGTSGITTSYATIFATQ